MRQVVSKWNVLQCVQSMLNWMQRIYFFFFLFLKLQKNLHRSTREGDSSHISRCLDCPLYCFFEAQKRKFNLMTKTNALSLPEKKQNKTNFITYSHKQTICKWSWVVYFSKSRWPCAHNPPADIKYTSPSRHQKSYPEKQPLS